MAGVELVALRLFEPRGLAPVVRLRVSDPAAFLADRARVFPEAFGEYWKDYDGVFVQGVDADGRPFWTLATSSRVLHQAERLRGDLAGCSGVIEPAYEYEPPPCPA